MTKKTETVPQQRHKNAAFLRNSLGFLLLLGCKHLAPAGAKNTLSTEPGSCLFFKTDVSKKTE
jgi:hypothetical protein